MSIPSPWRGAVQGAGARRLAVLLLAGLAAAGCADVPNAVNPVSWYRGARDAIVGENPPPSTRPAVVQRDQTRAGTQASAPYPNLASVPEAPRVASNPASRQAAQQGLAADRASAEAADTALRQGTSPAATQMTRSQAAPPAAPVAVPRARPPVAPTVVAQAPAAPVVAQAPALPPASGDSLQDVLRRNFQASGGIVAPGSSAVPPAALSPAALSPAALSPAGAPRTGPAARPPIIAGVPGPVAAGGMRSHVASVYFTPGSAELPPGWRRALNEVVQLQRTSGGRLRVEGHASSRTKDMPVERHRKVNWDIAARRAGAVADGLVRSGASRDSVAVTVAGDSQPLYAEVMPAGEEENRRVEIYLE